MATGNPKKDLASASNVSKLINFKKGQARYKSPEEAKKDDMVDWDRGEGSDEKGNYLIAKGTGAGKAATKGIPAGLKGKAEGTPEPKKGMPDYDEINPRDNTTTVTTNKPRILKKKKPGVYVNPPTEVRTGTGRGG